MAAASANAILAFPNYVDPDTHTPVVSGGLWDENAPLSNLQAPYLAYKARTLDCTVSSATLLVDLVVSRDIRVIAVPRHNLTPQAQVTVTVFDKAGAVAANVTQDVWPVVYAWGSLPFEHESWADGKLTAEAARHFPMPLLVILPKTVIGRVVEIAIDDTANPDGFIELTRLFVSPGWQPSLNFINGAKLGVLDATVVTPSLGGADFYDPREKRRTAAFTFDQLPEDEALVNAFDMQMRLGLSGQLFFCWNPEDPTNRHRHSFLATLSQLDPLTAAAWGRMGASFQLKEVVA